MTAKSGRSSKNEKPQKPPLRFLQRVASDLPRHTDFLPERSAEKNAILDTF